MERTSTAGLPGMPLITCTNVPAVPVSCKSATEISNITMINM